METLHDGFPRALFSVTGAKDLPNLIQELFLLVLDLIGMRITHELPVIRQYPIPARSPFTVCYQPQPVSEADLALMRLIDALHTWTIHLPEHAC